MNFNLKVVSLIVGSAVGIIAWITVRHPVIAVIAAIGATGLTEGILRIQGGE